MLPSPQPDPGHPPLTPPSGPLGVVQACDWEGALLGSFRSSLRDPLPHPFPNRTPTLLQLLQGDQADGAGQRPGHEHTLGRDFPGKRRCRG